MAQPSSTDITPAFDPTAYASISGAQLLQFITGIAPYVDKGFTVTTTDIAGIPQVPDAVTTTKWQTYMWIRQMAGSVATYVWATTGGNRTDPNTGTNILQWVPMAVTGIPNGSITSNMIANGGVLDVNVANGISASKLIGSLPAAILASLITNTTAAGGDLTGTYPNPAIAAGAVTSAKLAALAITNPAIALKSVQATNILGDNVARDMLRAQVADPTVTEWFTPSRIVDSATGVVTTGNALKIPQVATAGAGDSGTWQMQTIDQLIAQKTTFSHTGILITAATSYVGAHGLGTAPKRLWAFLVNNTSEFGFTTGVNGSSQVPVDQFYDGGGFPIATIVADNVNVTVQIASTFASFFVKRISAVAGAQVQITNANWTLSVFAEL